MIRPAPHPSPLLTLALAASCALVGCGAARSDDDAAHAGGAGSSGASGAGGVAGGGSGGIVGAHAVASPIPLPGPAHPGDGAGNQIHAIKTLHFPVSPTEAFSRAYPIDGLKFTDADDPSHCKLRPGGKKKDVVIDGPNGEDNSFGKNLWPIFLGLAPDAEQTTNDGIASGGDTLLFRIAKLGTSNSYSPLFTEVFSVTAKRDAMGELIAPSTWETYEWQAYSDGLGAAVGSGDELRSLVQLPASYVIDDLWVAGDRRDITVWLSLSGSSHRLALNIHHAMVTYRVAADRQSGSEGIISGVLDTDELIERIRESGDPNWKCKRNISPLMQITGASDMMKDGTQSTATCDGISIAIGFDAVASKLGQAVAPPPPPHSCQ